MARRQRPARSSSDPDALRREADAWLAEHAEAVLHDPQAPEGACVVRSGFDARRPGAQWRHWIVRYVGLLRPEPRAELECLPNRPWPALILPPEEGGGVERTVQVWDLLALPPDSALRLELRWRPGDPEAVIDWKGMQRASAGDFERVRREGHALLHRISRSGRPPGTGLRHALSVAEVQGAYEALRADFRHPTKVQVADRLAVSESTLERFIAELPGGPPRWPPSRWSP